LNAIPGYRPPAVIPYLLCLMATAVLVMASELATFDPRDRPAEAGLGVAGQNSWSDPAMVGVGRWLAHWPGAAGVSALTWWAARIGAAGLLCQLAFSAIGAPLGPSIGTGVAPCLATAAVAMFSLTPRTRHLVHVALGVVAVAGLIVTVSGVLALRQGLVELLEDTSDLICVAAVGDAHAAVLEAAQCQPDIAVLDVMMPGGGGLSAALGIREVSPQTRMLAYSASSDRASVIQMLRSGARGYLVKGAPAQDLMAGLRRCAGGHTALSEGLSEHLVAEMGELGRAEQADSAAAKARYERLLKLLEPGVQRPRTSR
jgi:DNA-binding NarL/FixJ family response regulator